MRAADRLLNNDDFPDVLKYCVDEALIKLKNANTEAEILIAHSAFTAINSVTDTVITMNAYATPKKEH